MILSSFSCDLRWVYRSYEFSLLLKMWFLVSFLVDRLRYPSELLGFGNAFTVLAAEYEFPAFNVKSLVKFDCCFSMSVSKQDKKYNQAHRVKRPINPLNFNIKPFC